MKTEDDRIEMGEDDEINDWLLDDDDDIKEKSRDLDVVTEEFEGYYDEYSDISDIDEDIGDIVVPEDKIKDNYKSTKLQHNGKIYSTTIPKGLVKDTNVAKGDIVDFKIIKSEKGMAKIEITIEKKGYRMPVNDRIGGR